MTPRIKYPSTPHLPWSPGFVKRNDTRCENTSHLEGRFVVVTEKMDGENTTMYRDGLHARSLTSGDHPSRSWIKRFHAEIAHEIPEGWRICGENLFAQHSIAYEELPSYFMLFSIWDEKNHCLPWDEMVEWAKLLNLALPVVLYTGIFDEKALRALPVDTERSEGYVVRLYEGFSFENFNRSIAKWVRENHVRTTRHWMTQEVIPNGLRQESKPLIKADHCEESCQP